MSQNFEKETPQEGPTDNQENMMKDTEEKEEIKTERKENNNNSESKEAKAKQEKKEKKEKKAMRKKEEQEKEKMDPTELLMKEIVDKLKDPQQSVEVKDRSYRWTTYPKCFEGKMLVDWLVKHKYSADRKEAVAFGNLLMNDCVFFHVTRDHIFKDEGLFYRFKWDDPDAIQMPNESWINFVKTSGLSPTSVRSSELLPTRQVEGTENLIQALSKMEVFPLSESNLKLLDYVHPPKWINPNPATVYNMVVVGAGAAGLVCAAGAAGIGAKVAIVEANLMGGDCLNWGCVPSKALIRAAKACYEACNSQHLGVNVENVKIDFPVIMERMRKLRAEISKNDSVQRFAEKLGIDVFIGKGSFKSKDKVQVKDEYGKSQMLKFRVGVIATGARPSAPPIPGLDQVEYITNEGLFNLTVLPKRFLMIGAGPIGCEMAQSFRRFGAEVHLIELLPRVMGREDPEAGEIIYKQLKKEGVNIHISAKDLSLSKSEDSQFPIAVTFTVNDKKQTIMGDKLLFSTGRLPNVDNLGLDTIGVKFDSRKGVDVNDYMQTNVSNIYACGDVCTPYKFTHMADSMARMLIRNSLFYHSAPQSSLILPWCTYTHPEVAHVGFGEAELKEKHIPYQVFRAEFADNDRAILESSTEGFVKIYVKEGKDEILGADIVADNAGDMISEITAAMVGKIGLQTFSQVVHPYPTQAAIFRKLGDDCARQRLTPTVKIMFRKWLSSKR